MRENRRAVGTHYEEIAADFLKRQGIRIRERNFRCRMGEIDLIGEQEGTLVFVEVKYRKNSWKGAAAAAVHPLKQRTIRTVAEYYLICHGGSVDRACRFDVVAIEGQHLRWIPNAF